MRYEAINFGKKSKLFDEQWKPKVIAEMNDYQFKVVRLDVKYRDWIAPSFGVE
jgi:hypothetical protein